MLKENIKNEIIASFIPLINSWEIDDIYVISFFVYDMEDNPCKPTVTLGYNTEQEVIKNLKYADEQEVEQEVRWNYAYWPQNVEGTYGVNETSRTLIKEWILENNFLYMKHYNPFDTTTELMTELGKITDSFVQILIEVVKELHSSGVIRKKFKYDIPILIHELEYYDKIAEQNIEANGLELV